MRFFCPSVAYSFIRWHSTTTAGALSYSPTTACGGASTVLAADPRPGGAGGRHRHDGRLPTRQLPEPHQRLGVLLEPQDQGLRTGVPEVRARLLPLPELRPDTDDHVRLAGKDLDRACQAHEGAVHHQDPLDRRPLPEDQVHLHGALVLVL